jgi:hypothetical protein
LRTEAESKYNGTDYSSALTQNNATTTNGAGINSADATAVQLYTDASANGDVLFAITSNDGPKSYAIYGSQASNPGKYFCIDSTGSTSQSIAMNASVATPTCH